MKYLYAFILSLLMTVSSNAADYYFCDDGDDSTGDGTRETPWATHAKLMAEFDGAQPGDHYKLCKGGTFEVFNRLLADPEGTAIDRIYIEDYTAIGFTPTEGDDRPVFDSPDGTSAPLYLSYGAEYITIRNVVLDGSWVNTGSANWSVWLREDVHFITFDNVRFANWGVGIVSHPTPTGTGGHDTFIIENSQFYNIGSVGWLGGAKDLRFANNTFELVGNNNGGRPIYLSGDRTGDPTDENKNFFIVGNRFINNVPSDIGNGSYAGVWTAGQYGCNRQLIGGHGVQIGTRISNNYMEEIKGTSIGGCWAIAIDTAWPYGFENFSDLIIDYNESYWLGNLTFSCSNCDGVKINNNIGYTEHDGSVGVKFPNRPEDAPFPTLTGGAYRNLLVFDTEVTGNTIRGIQANGATGTNGDTVVSDIQYNVVIFGADSVNFRCTDTDAGSTVKHNFCFNIDSGGNFVINDTHVVATP